MECPFCHMPDDRVEASNAVAFVVSDRFPVAKGHTLIIPKRHYGSLFESTETEWKGLWDLMTSAKERLQKDLKPDGFNVGVNDGPAAGQTVPHLHIHLIPRYKGDRPDPRGGVRWIFPEKADYWSGQ